MLRATLLVLLLAACGKVVTPAPDAGAGCAAGEHRVGGTCVANGFDEADLPAPGTTPIDGTVEGGLYLRGTALLGLKDPAATREAAQTVATAQGGQVVGAIRLIGLFQVRFTDALTAAALDAKLAALAADPAVDFAVRDAVYPNASTGPMRAQSDLERLTVDSPFEDSNYPGTYGLVGATGRWAYESIGVYRAWDAIYAANPQTAPVVVGVLDDLVTKDPVFSSLKFGGAQDVRAYGDYTPDPGHPQKHGNQVGAVIAAPNNGAGMNGILTGLDCLQSDLSPQAVIANWVLPDGGVTPSGAFAFEGQNYVALDAILMGVVNAVRSGARVVNMSLGGNYPVGDPSYPTVSRIYRRLLAQAKQTLFVVSGRNDGADDSRALPCAASFPNADTLYSNILCVDPLKHDGITRARWPLADGGMPDLLTVGSAELAAPGEDVLSQLPNGSLAMFLGSSAAAPVVSGVAGLVLTVNPELTGAELKTLLLQTADRTGSMTTAGLRVNAEAAVKLGLDHYQANHADFSPGSCQTDGNACPIDATCIACLTTLSMVVTEKSGAMLTFKFNGELQIGWPTENTLDFTYFSLDGEGQTDGGQARPFFTFGPYFSTTPPMLAEVTRTDLHLVATGDVGSFMDGTLDPLIGSPQSYAATRGELSAHVSQTTLTGTLTLDDGAGTTALITFSGDYRPKLGAMCPK